MFQNISMKQIFAAAVLTERVKFVGNAVDMRRIVWRRIADIVFRQIHRQRRLTLRAFC